jgi:hypothetical protein
MARSFFSLLARRRCISARSLSRAAGLVLPLARRGEGARRST